MSQIAEKALEHGAHRVITFVGRENIPSLKGCQRAGFNPYCTRIDRWLLMRQSCRFMAVSR